MSPECQITLNSSLIYLLWCRALSDVSIPPRTSDGGICNVGPAKLIPSVLGKKKKGGGEINSSCYAFTKKAAGIKQETEFCTFERSRDFEQVSSTCRIYEVLGLAL